ncbi:LuxR C-terminal-related transcriptional regulator [Klebsiella sp. MISC125]|uniref:LuxR C-terminal-related transcriptional regulator n=1 Tax=Klebsiella sp. MISC125 TaxID=2755386 RepID=UPI003DAA072C
MLIYSSDQYFSLAMNEILSEFKNKETKDLILVDSGMKDLYIFEVKMLSGILHQDSFSALINSQYIALPRNADIVQLQNCISTGAIPLGKRDKKMDMTRMEESVLRALYAGLSMNDIAEHYGMSSKRVSSLKRGALTKMGIENIPLFFSLLRCWNFFWPFISCFYPSAAKSTERAMIVSNEPLLRY